MTNPSPRMTSKDLESLKKHRWLSETMLCHIDVSYCTRQQLQWPNKEHAECFAMTLSLTAMISTLCLTFDTKPAVERWLLDAVPIAGEC